MIISLQVRGERIELETDIDINTLLIPDMAHVGCGGFVERWHVTPPNAVLICRGCGIRILIPEIVQTIDDLEQWAFSHIS